MVVGALNPSNFISAIQPYVIAVFFAVWIFSVFKSFRSNAWGLFITTTVMLAVIFACTGNFERWFGISGTVTSGVGNVIDTGVN